MASEVVEALLDIFCLHGIPKTVLSDQGTQFMSSMMRATCKQLGVKQIRTTPYHPQSNGCVERLHGSLLPMLRKTTRKGLEWHLQLKYALFALRVTPNRSTGFPPAQIAFGHNLCSPLDLLADELEPSTSSNVKVSEWVEKLMERITLVREAMSDIQERTSQKRKEQYDKTAIAGKTFKEGQLVLTRNPGLHKLDSVWDGPFEVMEVPNDMHVIIATPGNGRGKRKRVHVVYVQSSQHQKLRYTGW